MTSTSDHASNLAQVAQLATRAESEGAFMLLLPEAFSFIGSHYTQTIAQAESLDGQRMEEFRKIARKHNLWLSLGGFHEKMGSEADSGDEDLERVSNTHIIIDGDGVTKAVYRKIHLFDVNIPNGPILLESRYTQPGDIENNNLVVVDSPAGKIGLTTCYDLRFPELYTKLAHKKGADILLVPSAFTVPTGKAHWHLLLRARAVENQCYVLAAAQVGQHSEKRQSFGHALAVDPWGRVVGDCGGALCDSDSKDGSPTLVTVEIDLDVVKSLRTRMPIKKHRRFDV